MRDSERRAEYSVRTKAGFVLGTINSSRMLVNIPLIFGFRSGQGIEYFAIYGLNGIQYTLAAKAVAPVSKLQHLVPGRRTGRHRRSAERLRPQARHPPRPSGCRGCQEFLVPADQLQSFERLRMKIRCLRGVSSPIDRMRSTVKAVFKGVETHHV